LEVEAVPDVKHFDPSAVVGTVQQLLWQRGWANIGVQDIVDVSGVGRSSLYATFGSKQDLCLAAIHHYLAEQAIPAFAGLEADGRGLPAIAKFFGGLITARSVGPRARWGCLVSNLQADGHGQEPGIAEVLAEHNRRLLAALSSALGSADDLSQLRENVDLHAAAEHLALLAHGINLRSKAGADEVTLRGAVSAALNALRRPGETADTWPR
jgi:TetR/AcrR family transcriptional repressor of nem operon